MYRTEIEQNWEEYVALLKEAIAIPRDRKSVV